ncbi:MAG: hypothetical protein AB9879_01070 [Methanothrix sp.]
MGSEKWILENDHAARRVHDITVPAAQATSTCARTSPKFVIGDKNSCRQARPGCLPGH